MATEHQMMFGVDFCERCGAAAEEIMDGKVTDCVAGENVVAIRGHIARRRLDLIVALVRRGCNGD